MLDSLFLSICNMSFIASYVIIFVMATRLLLVKTPRIFSYSLWSVVLFRLLCPFSFESEFSVFEITGKTVQNIQPFPDDFHTASNIGTSNEVVIDTVSLKILEEFATKVEPLFSSILTLIWLIGIATMLICSIVQFVKLQKQLIGSIPFGDNIHLADHINSPFVIGLFKPKIYLPSSLLEDEQDYIIAHENHHIKRLDHITRLLGFIVLSIHWFNPFVWVAFILAGKDMEMSCDEAVMKKMNKDIRVEYSSSILRFATGRKLISATPLAFGEGDTKGRVANVMKYKKPLVCVCVLTIIVVACVAIALITNPIQKEDIYTIHDFNDDGSFDAYMYGGQSFSFGHTALKQGDEVIISIFSDQSVEIEIGIEPFDIHDTEERDNFIGESIVLSAENQEISIIVPKDDIYTVTIIKDSDDEVFLEGSVVYNRISDFKSIEIGTEKDKILEHFGEPDGSLFGMHGDIYIVGDKQITIYYGYEGENSYPVTYVKTDDYTPK